MISPELRRASAIKFHLSCWLVLCRSCSVWFRTEKLLSVIWRPYAEHTIRKVLRWNFRYMLRRIVRNWLFNYFELTFADLFSGMSLLWSRRSFVPNTIYLSIICWVDVRWLHVSWEAFVCRLRTFVSCTSICSATPWVGRPDFWSWITGVFLAKI